MDRYEVMAGKMTPLTDGAHRKWGFAGKVETRSYERLVDALIDFVETGDGLKARFLTGFAACLAADRKSVENLLPARQEGITDMDKEIRYFVNGWSFRLSFATRPGYDGDHEDISDGDSYELGEYENSEEALAAAEAFISTHGNEVNDEEDGIGSVIYWTVEVERRVEYKENEWLPCDESGRIDDGYGNEPNATVAYLSSLEGSREERAFELAKNEYLAWLEHKADRYTTVYGYMD